MCGIAGGFFWGGRIDRVRGSAAVRSMVDAMPHRGPDGHGIYCSQSSTEAEGRPFAVLGHRRLAIIDVSDAGLQPMGGDNGAPCITYNGEAYNFLELKTELERQGVGFRNKTDTEVILRGYDVWGLDVVGRLRGMFAFGIWDTQRTQLLLARDHLGIKPLYYYRGDGFLLFASEVRALLATGLVPRRLDVTALWQYLAYQAVPARRTLIEGVHVLGAGSWMTIDAEGETATKAYWNMLTAASAPASDDADETRRHVAALLRDSVASHLVSDVPVGAFLSGGIDSSAVVALMREAGLTPRTFSVGFNERAFDETAHAAVIAEKFRTEHTHIRLTDDDLLDALPRALTDMDLPTGDGVNTHVISGAVRAQGITVALSGLGGDEIFGGYPSFERLARIATASRLWAYAPWALRVFAAGTVRMLGGSSVPATKAAAVLETDGSLAATFPFTRQLLSAQQRTNLLNERVLDGVYDRVDPYERALVEAFEEHQDASLFAQISFAETRTYMHDVLLRDTDQMSMAHSLEVRVPLLDHRLVDYVTAVPDALKQANGVPKRLLVEAMGDLLPADIVHRPKQGFTLPFDPWMRGRLRPLCEHHLGETGLAGRGIFRSTEISRLWTAFLEGNPEVTWSRLWILVVLDAWLERTGVELVA